MRNKLWSLTGLAASLLAGTAVAQSTSSSSDSWMDDWFSFGPGQWYAGAKAGHEKGDGRYVLSRAPDYILMGNVAVLPYPLTDETMATKLVNKSEHELWADPEFHQRYELVSVRLASSGPFQYFTFYRKKAS